MIRLLDGPGAANTIRLRRAPIYLRITFDGEMWDGLDQLDDTPRANEKVFAYIKVADHGNVHVCGQDPKTRKRWGGWYHHAEYRVIAPQPDDATMRDNERWREWTHAEHARAKQEAAPAGLP